MKYYAGKHRTPSYVRRLNTVDFWQFLKDLEAYEKKMLFKKKQDEFLDIYSKYLKGEKDNTVKVKINNIVKELHRLNPNFSFKLK